MLFRFGLWSGFRLAWCEFIRHKRSRVSLIGIPYVANLNPETRWNAQLTRRHPDVVSPPERRICPNCRVFLNLCGLNSKCLLLTTLCRWRADGACEARSVMGWLVFFVWFYYICLWRFNTLLCVPAAAAHYARYTKTLILSISTRLIMATSSCFCCLCLFVLVLTVRVVDDVSFCVIFSNCA